MNKPRSGDKATSFAAATSQQCIPGQERVQDISVGPSNRYERRAREKQLKKISRKTGLSFSS